MNKKKGFTLIEIIICITLITIIGTAMTFTVLKSKDNKFKEVEKRILTAASVYVSTAKDENGETYENGIYNGGSGTVINLNVLYNNGFLSEDLKKEIEKRNYKLEDNYVLALLGNGEEGNDCNGINYTLSWDKIDKSNNKDKTVYLCKKNNQQQTTDTNIKNIIQSVKMKVHIDKNAVSTEFYNKLSAEEKAKFTDKENGLYAYYQENQGDGGTVYYYYRGAVNNNYVKFGTENNKELTWRILWINDKNEMKLILDDERQISYIKRVNPENLAETNEDYLLEPGERYYMATTKNGDKALFYDDDSIKFCVSGYNDIDCKGNGVKNVLAYNEKTKIFIDNISGRKNYEEEIYINFESNTKIDSIKEYEFCENNVGSLSYDTISNDFVCTDSPTNSQDKGKNKYKAKFGYLTYGELARAGVIDNIDIFKNYKEKGYNQSSNFILSKNPSNKYLTEKIKYFLNYSPTSIGYEVNAQYLYINDISSSKFKLDSSTSYWHIYRADANSIKPVIVVDLNKYELSDSTGTNDDMFTLIEKTE